MNEQTIIKQAMLRNREAQGKLYTKYQTAWFMISMRYAKNRDDALDVLQNALIKIFSKLDQFDVEKGSFKSWSSKIVVNESLMFLRKHSYEFLTDDLECHFNLQDETENALDILSTEELTRMIQNLPAGYRAIFNLYVIEGYNHQEIGEMLEISAGTSKSQFFKAKKLLRKRLEVLI